MTKNSKASVRKSIVTLLGNSDAALVVALVTRLMAVTVCVIVPEVDVMMLEVVVLAVKLEEHGPPAAV